MIRSRYTIQVQAVFTLYDILTGRPVQPGNVRFFLPEGGRITYKEGGYYVLTGCRDTQITLAIESPVYERAEIAKKLGKPGVETDRVWLSPDSAYPGFCRFPYVKGRTEPYAQVRAAFVDSRQKIRLLKDYAAREEKTAIPVFCGEKTELAGRQIAAVSAKKHGWEAEFSVVQNIDETSGLCHIEKPFSGDLKKEDVCICPVFSTQADKEGSYRLLLPKEAAQAQLCFVFFEEKGKTKVQETKILTDG
ncbi:MAG: hypothetical protein HFG54_10110 [Lachnospiraceae bacterium]|nr:hypothetical protein [Lachnospiraceae bacterium]